MVLKRSPSNLVNATTVVAVSVVAVLFVDVARVVCYGNLQPSCPSLVYG